MNGDLLIRRNAEPAPLADVPLIGIAAFRTTVLDAVNNIKGLLQDDPKFRKTLDHIINTIRIE